MQWIFSGEQTYESHLKRAAQLLRHQVKTCGDQEALGRDPEQWLAELLSQLPQLPTLRERSEWWLDPRSSASDAILHVPFDGEEEAFLWRLGPAQSPPGRLARVHEGELLVPVSTWKMENHGKSAPDKAVEPIEKRLESGRAVYRAVRARTEPDLRQAIADRRAAISRHQQVIATQTVPIRRRHDAPKTFKADPVVRRRAPVADKWHRHGAAPPRPALSDQFFDHTVSVIRAAGRAMTRSPRTYRDWGEEDRRQVLLLMLNTHYEGKVAAEVFNAEGRTDILIRHEDRNLLVAECKFWAGAKHFGEAVDQLFAESTWHDVRLALIVFVENRAFTEVITRAREALELHQQFAAWVKTGKEGELRAQMTWPGDPDRRVTLHVSLIHTPAAAANADRDDD